MPRRSGLPLPALREGVEGGAFVNLVLTGGRLEIRDASVFPFAMLAVTIALPPLMGYMGAVGGGNAVRTGAVMMRKDVGRYMYDEPYAPAGMGREFINADGVRKPLEDFVGASEELNLAAYFKGEAFGPWDPMGLTKLSKVSANNPDVAWLREAELKHGRVAMLAFVGIVFTAGDVHFGAAPFVEAASAGWPDALGAIQKANYGIFAQGVAAIAIVEGVSNTNRGRGAAQNWWDGLWLGERAPEKGFDKTIVPGDFGWDPLKLMPKEEKAANLMRLKELKNGRLAMLSVMGIFMQYMNTGKDPFS